MNNREEEFYKLAEEWKNSRNPFSDIKEMTSVPAYSKIVLLGWPAVPLILKELSQELDHWFEALFLITGENPVPEPDLGKMKLMRDYWLEWGKSKKLV